MQRHHWRDCLYFLQALLKFIADVIGLSNPLYALTTFHGLIKRLDNMLFMTLIPFLGRQLSAKFGGHEVSLLRHIRRSATAAPDAAIENMVRETYGLIDQPAALNQISFGLAPWSALETMKASPPLPRPNTPR